MSSKSCNSISNHFCRLSKLARDSQLHIVCNLSGTIHSIRDESKNLNEIEHIGHPLYSLMEKINDKYCFSRHHLDVLLNIEEGCHNFFITDLSMKTDEEMRTVLLKESECKLHIFQFESKSTPKVRSPRSSFAII
jgi:hypothetical protein